jgi:hypothetical protein
MDITFNHPPTFFRNPFGRIAGLVLGKEGGLYSKAKEQCYYQLFFHGYSFTV